LTYGADRDAVGALAVEVFDEGVGCVGFEGDAVVVVAVDEVAVGYGYGGATVDVPAMGWLVE
jgi:hypothetical protein